MPLLFWLGSYTDMDLYWSQILFGKNLTLHFYVDTEDILQ